MARTAIIPDDVFDTTTRQYTPAIRTDTAFHISGQVARNPDGEIVGDDVASQARQAFANVESILNEIDMGFEDVVKITSYVVGIHENYEAFKAVYGEMFSEPYPCHTMLGVAGLANESLLVELEVDVDMT